MPVLPKQFSLPRVFLHATLLLALAGCSTQPVDEPPTDLLPGNGTYTWEHGTVEPVPGVASREPGPADALRTAIDDSLGRRGYAQRSEAEAAWRVSYRSGQETRKEKLVPDDRVLQARMACYPPPMECQIIHEFVHFGPPKRPRNPEFDVTVDTVQVQIHDVKSGRLVWQGKVDAPPGDDGQPDQVALRKKMDRLLRSLPSARHRKLSQTSPAAAPAAQ